MNIKNLLVGTCLAYKLTDTEAAQGFRGTSIHPRILEAQNACSEAATSNPNGIRSAKDISDRARYAIAQLELTYVKKSVKIEESKARMPGIPIVTGGLSAAFIRLITLVNNDRKIKENKIAEKTHAQFKEVMTELKATVKKIT